MALCSRATAAASEAEGRAASRCTQQAPRKAHDVTVNGKAPTGLRRSTIARLELAAQHADNIAGIVLCRQHAHGDESGVRCRRSGPFSACAINTCSSLKMTRNI